MAFEKTVPEWAAEGTEPPSILKASGWAAGNRPPADYFNWQWHGIGEAVKELQENLGNVDNTSDADKPVSEAVTQALANKADLGDDGKVLPSQLPEAQSITIDSALSASSTNPVQNKVVKAALDLKANASDIPEASAGLTPVTTAGTGAAYTATVDGIDALAAGVCFVMVTHTVSTSTSPTLNVNGLGAKSIRRRMTALGTTTVVGYAANWLTSGKPFFVMYDGTYWVVEDMPQVSVSDLYGTVAVPKGGTGKTSFTADSFLVGNGTSALAEKTASEVAELLGGTKIQTGSYVGTGTYGSANPCSLTFDFAPKVLLVYSGERRFSLIMYESLTTLYTLASPCAFYWARLKTTWSENSVSWYVDAGVGYQSYNVSADMIDITLNADQQHNQIYRIYWYVAIG